MPTGCMNTGAVNFDPTATTDNGSCIYLEKIDGVCYKFTDYSIDGVVDKGFTISYALESNHWTFFHDYIPDYYFHTRERLHLIKARNVYVANEDEPGKLFDTSVRKSFFIDVVFRTDDEQTLNTINWISERLGTTGQDQEFATLTHLTIWNSYQCTGRIPIAQSFDGLTVSNIRRTQAEWSFNDFRDLVATRGTKFLGDIFHDFAVDTSTIDANLPWYEKKLLEDNYFIVRFEFDNSSNNVVFLHDVKTTTTKSTR